MIQVSTTPYNDRCNNSDDYLEGIGQGATLIPQSLYLDQKARRLNGAPSVIIAQPSNGTTLTEPANITIVASTSSTAIANVKFYSNNTILGSVTQPPYQYAWQNVPVGTHLIRVLLTDNAGNTAEDTVQVSVGPSGGGVDPPSGGGQGQEAFQQDDGANGFVSIEADNYTANDPQAGNRSWVETSSSQATGGQAMRASPPRGNLSSTYLTESPRLDYKVRFVKSGPHYVHLKGLGSASFNNSVFVGFEGADGQNFSFAVDPRYTWKKRSSATFNVPAPGVYTVNVWMRESGFILDKLVITSNPNYSSSGNGPAESPTIGSANVELSVDSMDFGSQVVGGISSPSPLTLTNSGTAPLDISNIIVSSGFIQTNDCGDELAAGASCTVNIQFAPTATGAVAGELSISSNVGTRIVSLSGNAIAAPSTGSAISVTASAAGDGTVPANTLDGDLGTRWSALGDGSWIQYDLGAEQTISSLKLAWFNGDVRTANFDVQVSSDNVNWTDVLTDQVSSGQTLELESYAFPPVTTRYVRIIGYGNTDNNWNSITETKIGSGSAISVAASAAGDGTVPANTLDGDLGTRWSALGDGSWIQYDLGAEQTISSVKLAWFNGDVRTANFDVQVSSDNANWTDVLTDQVSSGQTLELESYAFSPVTTRYVRIIGYGNTDNNWNSITETKIW